MIEEINNLLKNTSLIEELTQNAFNFINENFTWDVLIDKYIQLYEK
jgi:glycosyltransferase involved in cell wall biosynthesis